MSGHPYVEALEAAGVVVVVHKSFGSCQGDWWAKVEYEGVSGWVHGAFGSCDHCDAFLQEFGWNEGCCSEHDDPVEGCQECEEATKEYQARLADFGRGYLPPYSQEEAERLASENLEWDSEASCMLDFIRERV